MDEPRQWSPRAWAPLPRGCEVQGREKHGNEKKHGNVRGEVRWTFWPFLPRNPTFSCAVPSNCLELFARTLAWTLPLPCFFVPKKCQTGSREGWNRIEIRSCFKWHWVGNGRNTVSRVLFWQKERTHWILRQTRGVLRQTRWVRFGNHKW